MRAALSVLLLVVLFAGLAAAGNQGSACNPEFNGPLGHNPDCQSSTPYCMPNDESGTSYRCAPCNPAPGSAAGEGADPNCDCNHDKYCSADLVSGDYGFCKDWNLDGDDCVPNWPSNLLRFSKGKRCGKTYTDSLGNKQYEPNGFGVCLNSVCRRCDPFEQQQTHYNDKVVHCSSGNGPAGASATEGSDGGRKRPRVCTSPGHWKNIEGNPFVFWRTSEFGQHPDYVWLMLIWLTLCCMCCASMLTAVQIGFSGWTAFKRRPS